MAPPFIAFDEKVAPLLMAYADEVAPPFKAVDEKVAPSRIPALLEFLGFLEAKSVLIGGSEKKVSDGDRRYD